MARQPTKLEKLIAKEKAEELAKLSKYILSISASDYVKGVGKSLKDFELASVDATARHHLNDDAVHKAKKRLYEKGQELEAEIIVDYKGGISSYRTVPMSSSTSVHLLGTALIPKDGKKE